MPDLDFWKWSLMAFCAFMTGIAKTGVPGANILSVPIFVLAVGDARMAAGWLLPVLITADLFGVWYYRKHDARKALLNLAPWVVVGMVIGTFILGFPEMFVRRLVGGIIFLILILYFLKKRGLDPTPAGANWASGFYGTATGLATMVANAAGPVMSVYLLTRNLPRHDFVATGAWFFFIINLVKLPVYYGQGMITQNSLTANLILIPFVTAGAMVGRRILMILPEEVFINSVTILALISTIFLFLPR